MFVIHPAELEKTYIFMRLRHGRRHGVCRKAATEAVEAALSSADADREEACAEVKRRMMTEVGGSAFPRR